MHVHVRSISGGDTWTAGNWSIATHLCLSWGAAGPPGKDAEDGAVLKLSALCSGTTVARTTVPGGDDGDLLSQGLTPEQQQAVSGPAKSGFAGTRTQVCTFPDFFQRSRESIFCCEIL